MVRNPNIQGNVPKTYFPISWLSDKSVRHVSTIAQVRQACLRLWELIAKTPPRCLAVDPAIDVEGRMKQCTALIRKHGQAKLWHEALAVFEEMVSQGLLCFLLWEPLPIIC